MMFKRLLAAVVLLPIALLLIAFIVANREMMVLEFSPFSAGGTSWQVRAPVFLFLFAALGLGVVLGGVASWVSQRPYRKIARHTLRRHGMRRETPHSTHLVTLQGNDSR